MMAKQFGAQFAQVRAFIRGRSARERKALLILGLAGALAVFVQVIWTLENNRRSLRHRLPVLALQIEQMKQLAQTRQALLTADTTPAPMSQELARAALERHLAQLGTAIKAQWTPNGDLVLKGYVDFAVWIRWTAKVHEEHRFVMERCQLRALKDGMEVNATYSLARVSP